MGQYLPPGDAQSTAWWRNALQLGSEGREDLAGGGNGIRGEGHA